MSNITVRDVTMSIFDLYKRLILFLDPGKRIQCIEIMNASFNIKPNSYYIWAKYVGSNVKLFWEYRYMPPIIKDLNIAKILDRVDLILDSIFGDVVPPVRVFNKYSEYMPLYDRIQGYLSMDDEEFELWIRML